MTEKTAKYSVHISASAKIYLKIMLGILVMVLAIINSGKLSASIISGARLALLTIIPSLFPMFIISDFLCSQMSARRRGLPERMFERCFGVSGCAMTAFLCGNVCGFPVGASCCAELLSKECITEDECEYMIAISSCPSAAFVISGIGAGLRGSVSEGVMLYFCVIFSALICGLIHRKSRVFSENNPVISRQSYNLVSSIKNSTSRSVSVCAYIVFFSAVLALLGTMIKNDALATIITSALEIGNAASRLNSGSIFRAPLAFSLTGFALGFSGISVYMQIRSIVPERVKMRTYLRLKIEQGILCGVLAYIIYMLCTK